MPGILQIFCIIRWQAYATCDCVGIWVSWKLQSLESSGSGLITKVKWCPKRMWGFWSAFQENRWSEGYLKGMDIRRIWCSVCYLLVFADCWTFETSCSTISKLWLSYISLVRWNTCCSWNTRAGLGMLIMPDLLRKSMFICNLCQRDIDAKLPTLWRIY